MSPSRALDLAGFVLVFGWFLGGGVAHFIATDFFVAIVPSFVPYPRAAVLLTGLTDIAGALGILWPRTRRFAGYALILYCVCVLPVHTEMLRHAERYPGGVTLLWARLLFQPVLIWLIWRVTKPGALSAAPASS